MDQKTKVTKDLDNFTLTIERVLPAPKNKVWQAYADKAVFVKWFGPEGWEASIKESDFRAGGRYHYGMKCVDESQGEWFGQEVWGVMAFEAVNEPDSFSYKDYFADADANINTELPSTTTYVELIEVEGGTNLVTRCVANSAEEIEKLLSMGMDEGYASSMVKLEEVLARQ